MRKWTRGLLAALLVAGAAACSDSNEPDDATITIDNQSGETISLVFFRECGDDSWGSDRLGSSEVIADGDDRIFDVEAGCYDIRVLDFQVTEQQLLNNEIADGEEFVWIVQAFE